MIITHKLQPMDLTHKQNTIRVDVVQDDKYSRNLEFTLTVGGVTVVEITPRVREL